MRVSLVTTVKNEARTIGPCLESVLRGTRLPDEIVIVDGGSTDTTTTVVEEYRHRGVPVTVVQAGGCNIAQGRNIGIRSASAEIIAVTDAGCRVDRDWLRKLCEPFETDPDVDVVGGAIVSDAVTFFEHCAGPLTISSPQNQETFLPFSRNTAFKKEAWARVGGYPEWLYCGEDSLFSNALRRAGMKFWLARDAVVYWRPRSNIWAVFKQYFLYGVGNGRNDVYTPILAWQALKNALAVGVCCALLLAREFVLLLAVAALGLLLALLRYDAKREHRRPAEWLLGIIIVRVRNLAESCGFVLGSLQRWLLPRYSTALTAYRLNATRARDTSTSSAASAPHDGKPL